jgi:hypothetical protein
MRRQVIAKEQGLNPEDVERFPISKNEWNMNWDAAGGAFRTLALLGMGAGGLWGAQALTGPAVAPPAGQIEMRPQEYEVEFYLDENGETQVTVEQPIGDEE